MALSAEAVQAAGLGETRAWLADTGIDGIWHEATVVDCGEGGTATLRRDDGVGEPVVVFAEELKLVNTLPEAGVEDMTKLDYLHEPALLRNLHRRFGRDLLYTYTGRICIAVNPFNWQVSRPFYDEALLRRYRAARFGSLPPHVFAIAEAAYAHVCAPEGLGLGGGASQAVLVSGESGAGKTEAVKIMMNYLAVVSSSSSPPSASSSSSAAAATPKAQVAQQVMASNPLLEAFGNAKTSRNDNSSRFGKFIELQFDRAHQVGARVRVRA